jgi:ferredoxin-NADP reductase
VAGSKLDRGDEALSMSLLDLKVATAVPETELIRRLVLEPVSGVLPGFDAGASITLHVPGVGRRRYSLVNADPGGDGAAQPPRYELAVRLEAEGGGGSRWVHALKPGDMVRAEPPQNAFALVPGPHPVLLLAGGIGVTPLVSKAASMVAQGRPFRFVYAARRRADFAYLPQIRALAGETLALHADDEAGHVLDVPGLLAALPPGTEVHVCGPRPMLAAATETATRLGWPDGRLCFERFYSLGEADDVAPAGAGDGSFEVEIASSGQVFTVPPDKSIVQVLVEAGVDPLHDCMRGECGVCQVGVVAGTPDHRDSILSESERAAGKVMQICISRSRSPRLKLDL